MKRRSVSPARGLSSAATLDKHAPNDDQPRETAHMKLLKSFFLKGRSRAVKAIALLLVAARPILFSVSFSSAKSYMIEGVSYVAAYAAACNAVEHLIYREADGDAKLAAMPMRVGALARTVQGLCMLGFLLHTWIGCISYWSNDKYLSSPFSPVFLLVLHWMFYGPLWALLALWIMTCALLASRIDTATMKVEQLKTKNDFKQLQLELLDVHDSATAMSKFKTWLPYAFGGLAANGFYMASRFNEGGKDFSTISGILFGVCSIVMEADTRIITGIFFPVVLSLLQVGAVELLPNASQGRLRSIVKRQTALYGYNSHEWPILNDFVQAHSFTIRVPFLGDYGILALLRCQILREFVFGGKKIPK